MHLNNANQNRHGFNLQPFDSFNIQISNQSFEKLFWPKKTWLTIKPSWYLYILGVHDV